MEESRPEPPNSTPPNANPLTRGSPWPRLAAICLIGTFALVVSAIVPKDDLPIFMLIPAWAITILSFVVAIMTSMVAILELLSGGLKQAGSPARGLAYLAIYLLPWVLIVGATGLVLVARA